MTVDAIVPSSIQIGPQLVSLKLKGARIIEGATFRDMVCRFKNMRYLSLDGTFYVKSEAINALAMAGQQLHEVGRWGPSVDACWFYVTFLFFVLPLWSVCLTRACVYPYTTNHIIISVGNFFLKSFFLLYYYYFFLRNVLQVCLCGFRQLKDEDVQLILDSCPALTLLSVADCTSLGSLILFSRQLRTLDVSRCIHISDMSLEMPGTTEPRSTFSIT